MKLLTESNTKILKSREFGYMTFGLHFAPAKLSGHEVCIARSPGCTYACLNTAGHGMLTSVQKARVEKTRLFFSDRAAFMEQLVREISNAIRKAGKQGLRAAFRLNLTSDIPWESFPAAGYRNVMDAFPKAQFYDYTKIPVRMKRFLRGELPPNYHLTFSRSESNDRMVLDIAAKGGSIAAVFHPHLPSHWKGLRVIDADGHDLRFLDPRGCVAGLSVKGRAGRDTSGFVIRL